MSYQIITDSGCDFTKEKYEALGLIAAPLTVNLILLTAFCTS